MVKGPVKAFLNTWHDKTCRIVKQWVVTMPWLKQGSEACLQKSSCYWFLFFITFHPHIRMILWHYEINVDTRWIKMEGNPALISIRPLMNFCSVFYVIPWVNMVKECMSAYILDFLIVKRLSKLLYTSGIWNNKISSTCTWCRNK